MKREASKVDGFRPEDERVLKGPRAAPALEIEVKERALAFRAERLRPRRDDANMVLVFCTLRRDII